MMNCSNVYLRFPPKLAKPKTTNQRRNDVFPSIALAKSDIWDESVRLGIAKPKYTKKELDDRRAKVSGHFQRPPVFSHG